jgi:hypothetical protein
MALTRPKIWDLDTNIEFFTDPITVLHQGATTANIDVGFLFNRANGLVSNVALYWSESGNTFVTAFTSNTGTTDSNLVATSYAPINTGAHTVTGNINIAGNILPSANVTYNIGSSSSWFNTFYGISTQAKYADLAENYQADLAYTPGTVLVFGGDKEVTTTDIDHDTRVAGIVSTNPAHLMNGGLQGENVVAVGLTGRLPCRVQGPITAGQVLVTSTVPGVAQAIENSKFLPGCVVGKSLEDINTSNIETIEVVVGRF